MAGISLGCVAWGAASTLGLTALLAASEVAYRVLQLFGAAYLIWLGASGLWHTVRPARRDTPEIPAVDFSACRGFRAGLVTNLLNLKVGVFYLSLLPQFLPTGAAASPMWGALLVAVHVSIGVLWLGVATVADAR